MTISHYLVKERELHAIKIYRKFVLRKCKWSPKFIGTYSLYTLEEFCKEYAKIKAVFTQSIFILKNESTILVKFISNSIKTGHLIFLNNYVKRTECFTNPRSYRKSSVEECIFDFIALHWMLFEQKLAPPEFLVF